MATTAIVVMVMLMVITMNNHKKQFQYFLKNVQRITSIENNNIMEFVSVNHATNQKKENGNSKHAVNDHRFNYDKINKFIVNHESC